MTDALHSRANDMPIRHALLPTLLLITLASHATCLLPPPLIVSEPGSARTVHTRARKLQTDPAGECADQRAALDLHNAARAAHGVRALNWNATLAAQAKAAAARIAGDACNVGAPSTVSSSVRCGARSSRQHCATHRTSATMCLCCAAASRRSATPRAKRRCSCGMQSAARMTFRSQWPACGTGWPTSGTFP